MEKIQYDYVLVRYGELCTKGKNRKDFTRKLTANVKQALYAFPELTYQQTYDRLYIMLNGCDETKVCELVKKVFGLYSFSLAIKVKSEIDEIVQTAFRIANDKGKGTFKIKARRNDKSFPLMSDDINRLCATEILKNTEMKVDVHQPDLAISIEVRSDFTYIMSEIIKGAGGYPVGVGGRALLMLSGGIDSPVAGYLAMKRGVELQCIHFASPPYTSSSAQKKVLDLANMISGYQGKMKVHVIPFTDMQLAINQHCDESYTITIMRRMMIRIAEKVALANHCKALVNGESLGQVASQTLDSMATIGVVASMPILRPVVTYDKLEIIDVAIKIGTYATSILPFEDCCTIFNPSNPTTKPHLDKVERMESSFDFESLVEACATNAQTIYVDSRIVEESDLF